MLKTFDLETFGSFAYVIDMSVISFFLLLYIYKKNNKKNNRGNTATQYLSITTVAVLILLLLESSTYILSNLERPELIPISIIMFTIQFFIPVFAVYCYAQFIYSYTNNDKKMNFTVNLFFMIPLIITVLLIATNVFTGAIFRISSTGTYYRGPAYSVSFIVNTGYLLSIATMIIKYRKQLTIKESVIFHLFWILPLIGGTLQTLYFGTLIMWNLSAFSLMIIYFYSEGKFSKSDILTGALTRASFEKYIDNISDNSQFGLAFFDLDDFKSINDTYGHAIGDTALKVFATVVNNYVLPKELFVRYGGDRSEERRVGKEC